MPRRALLIKPGLSGNRQRFYIKDPCAQSGQPGLLPHDDLKNRRRRSLAEEAESLPSRLLAGGGPRT